MISKRKLRYLEGLLLLISIDKTESKRGTASYLGISIDTVTKYVAILESYVGYRLLINNRKRCLLTERAKVLVYKSKQLCSNNCIVNNHVFDLLEIKNLKAAFYLSAIHSAGNKRAASQMLAASVETINLYITYLEKMLCTNLIMTSNQGSCLTSAGKTVLMKFDMLADILIGENKQNKNTLDLRLALTNDIRFSITSINQSENQNIVVFADNPFSHLDDWDVAISYFEPTTDDLIVLYQRQIPCGFFASEYYLNKFGRPKDLDDMKENHLILDGSDRPYANKKYRNLIEGCKKIMPLNNSSIMLLDVAKYGSGICVVPLISSSDDLVHLDYLPCNIMATIYLTTHKNFKFKTMHKQTLDNCRQMLMDI